MPGLRVQRSAVATLVVFSARPARPTGSLRPPHPPPTAPPGGMGSRRRRCITGGGGGGGGGGGAGRAVVRLLASGAGAGGSAGGQLRRRQMIAVPPPLLHSRATATPSHPPGRIGRERGGLVWWSGGRKSAGHCAGFGLPFPLEQECLILTDGLHSNRVPLPSACCCIRNGTAAGTGGSGGGRRPAAVAGAATVTVAALSTREGRCYRWAGDGSGGGGGGCRLAFARRGRSERCHRSRSPHQKLVQFISTRMSNNNIDTRAHILRLRALVSTQRVRCPAQAPGRAGPVPGP